MGRTCSKLEGMGKDWPCWRDLDLPGLVFSAAHFRSKNIRKVQVRVGAADIALLYVQLMRQTRPPCRVFLRSWVWGISQICATSGL